MPKIREVTILSEVDENGVIYRVLTLHGTNERLEVRVNPTVYKMKVPGNENIDEHVSARLLQKREFLGYDVFIEVDRAIHNNQKYGTHLSFKLGKIITR